MKTCMEKKILKLNDPNLNYDVQQVVLVFLRFWKKPRRSQQTHKYVLFQRSHNVGYFMNINAFIYVILLIGQKSICSTILTVTYSNWYQSNIHYLQVYSMLKKSSQRDEKPFKIAKAKIRYEWTTILSTCWKNASII